MPGTGQLEFTRVRDRTVVTRAFAASPLKILNPCHGASSASAYLATYGGGLVGGDAIALGVEVGRGARARLATQASTKVYRSPLGTTQTLHAHVAPDGLLVVWPDPVTCFAGARYRQEQQIALDAGASLVLVDRLTAGRIASGERWQFDEYVSRTTITCGGRLVLDDTLALAREDDDIGRRLDRFDALALVVVLGPAVAPAASRLRGLVDSTPASRRADLLWSAAPVGDDGVLLRLASCSVERLASLLDQHLGAVTALLGEAPHASHAS